MKTTQIRMRVLLTLSLTVVGGLAPLVRGELCTVPFRCRVDSVEEENLGLHDIVAGDEFTGSYTFDTATPPSGYPSPGVPLYVFSGPQQRFIVSVGPYTWRSKDSWSCRVSDDATCETCADYFLSGAQGWDLFDLEQIAGPALPAGATSTVGWELVSRTHPSAITSTEMPRIFPDASLFEADNLLIVSVCSSGSAAVLVKAHFIALSSRTTVPNVEQIAESDAELVIKGARLVVGAKTSECSDTVAKDKVIRQSPAAGTTVSPNSAVNLVISSGWCPVTVGPDLCDGGVEYGLDPQTVNTGEQIHIVGRIKNTGTVRVSANTFEVRFYASADTTIDPAVDHQIAGGTFPNAIEPGNFYRFNLAALVNIPPGTYYVGWIIDCTNAVAETNESNNTVCITTFRLTIRATKVTVPNVEGKDEASAIEAIKAAALVVGVTTRSCSNTVAVGNVISQSPQAGSSVDSGSTVNLTISTGPCPVTVPNVVGKTEAQAGAAIGSAGLVVGAKTSQCSDTVAAGIVISQSPEPNASVPANSAVSLVISSGPCPKPNLVGTGCTFGPSFMVKPGDRVTVNLIVSNDSSVAFQGDITVEFTLSAAGDSPISLGLVTGRNVSIAEGGTTRISWEGALPSNLADGEYSLCWIMSTPVTESRGDDNNGCEPILLSVSSAQVVQGCYREGSTPPPGLIIQPSNPTSLDAIMVIVPTPVFKNLKEACQTLGDPKACIDTTTRTITLYFESVWPGAVPDIESPFCAIEVGVDLLPVGQWRFVAQVLDRAFDESFEVKEPVPAGAIVYVDCDATGADDGTSWENAFVTLQDALASAPAGSEIRVAEGTYRADSMFEVKSGQAVLGGFAGVGAPSPNLRAIVGQPTILSGDLNGDDADVPDVAQFDGEPTRSENSPAIVSLQSGDNTVFSGFTVQGAQRSAFETFAFAVNGGSPTISDCVFKDNTSPTVWNRSGSPSYTNCAFQHNYGAGMHNDHNTSPLVKNCAFSDNTGEGGGMRNISSNPTVDSCTFSGNRSMYTSCNGGGIYSYEGTLIVTNCTFNANKGMGMGAGGGLYVSKCASTVSNCRFTGNAAHVGGGLYSDGGSPTVNDCTFIGNSATSAAGGMYTCAGSTVTNCTFNGNYSALEGGGMVVLDGSTVTNCTLSGNSAGEGGGMTTYGSPAVTNCIIWANTGDQILSINPDPTLSHCCVQGGWSGPGDNNTDEDPQLDADGRLSAGSPCIDAGDNAAVTDSTDLAGDPRIVDGDGDGAAIVDMGAYEFQAPMIRVTVPDVVGMTQADAESAITSAGLTAGTVATEYSDTVGPGLVISQSPVAGSQADAGSAVNLVVSLGPGSGERLVAHWKLDEASGSTAHDSFDNGYHGTLYGNPQWQPEAGRVDGALLFDGKDDYVSLPIGSRGRDLTHCTIMAWVNWSGAGGSSQRVFAFGSGPAVNMSLTPKADSGGMRFAITTTGATHEDRSTAVRPLPTGWHHVAVTIDPTNHRHLLYLDGQVVAQNTSARYTPSSLGTTSQNWLGRSQYSADGYFSGLLDDVRIYEVVLSPEQIQEIVGPLAYWPFDEATGRIAYDSVGVCDGVSLGEPVWRPSGGQVGGALKFDGSNDCVVTDFVLNPADGPFSVFAWVQGGGAGQVIVSQDGSVGGTDWLGASLAGRLTSALCSPALTSSKVITDNQWHEVGLVWDGTGRTLYADGVVVGIDEPTAPASSTGGLNIATGKNLDAGTFWSGLIDDVRIYNFAVKP